MQLRPRSISSTPQTADQALPDIEWAIANLIAEPSDESVGIADLMLAITEPPNPSAVVVPDLAIEELAVPELNPLPMTRYALWLLAHSQDDRATGRGLMVLGMACSQYELYPLAHYYCAIAADVFRGLRSQSEEADALYHSGLAAYHCGGLDAAAQLLERARILNLVTNRMTAEANTLLWLGQIYTAIDQTKSALCCLLDSWHLFAEMGVNWPDQNIYRIGEMLALVRLGWVYEVEDMPLSALDSYRQAIALYQWIEPSLCRGSNHYPHLEKYDHNNHHSQLNGLMLKMAEVLYQAGELDEALACYRRVVWCHNQ